jgi:multiple sugar transport system permease protein
MVVAFSRLVDRQAPRLMVLPALTFLLVFSLLPFLYSLAMSISTSTLGRPLQGLVGLKNYTQGLGDGTFHLALINTLVFAFSVTIIETGLGLVLALIVLDIKRGVQALRTVALLPMLTPPIAVALIWQLIYAPTGGLVNHYLHVLGLTSQPIAFLANEHLAFPSVGFVDVWEWTPFTFLLSYAAVATLPQEPAEAAQVDGASPWQTLWHVTLPLLAPSLLIIFLIRLIMAFKVFDLIYMMTAGGPAFDTTTASYYIYQVGFQQFNTGYASALTTLLLIALTVIISLIMAARSRLLQVFT